MQDMEKENTELKRRIELISNLRGIGSQGNVDMVSNGSLPSEQCSRTEAVDSAWSQAQAAGSDQSSTRVKERLMLLEEMAGRSGTHDSIDTVS